MPKAFLLKKKIAIGQSRSNSPKLFSPSSSGISSPNSSPVSTESLSPRNDENENRFHSLSSPKYSFEKNDNQGLDLSIKSLLKESNNSQESTTFVSSYPYPAKFAKIADFIRVTESKNQSSVVSLNAKITDDTLKYGIERKNCPLPTLSTTSPSSKGIISPTYSKPINYSTTENLHQRISYSIDWSEHVSVNKVIVSPTSNSQRSDDSGRESFHSADDMDKMDADSNPNVNNNANNNVQSGKSRNKSDRYHCPDCNKSYSTQSGLAKHQEFLCATQVKKSFSCKHCEKVYVSLGALKMHIRTHTLPCKCKLCGKAFSRPWLLQGHIRTHTGEKPFACQFCNRAFADRSNLRAHLQTHSVVKKYSCKSCSRTFSRMSLLLKHEDNGCSGIRVHHYSNVGIGEKTSTSPSSSSLTLVPIKV